MYKKFSVTSREQRIGSIHIDTLIKFSNDRPKIDEKSQPILAENKRDTFILKAIKNGNHKTFHRDNHNNTPGKSPFTLT